MGLTIIKILVSIIMVVLLAEVSKRANPLLGGLLSGLPLGVGLSTYFISYSEGVGFFLKSIPWGVAGLASGIFFCFFYMIGAKICEDKNKAVSIFVSSLIGLGAFFLSGYLIYRMDLNLFLAIAIFILVFIANILSIKKLKIGCKTETPRKNINPLLLILIRGAIVATIIAVITGTASLVGSKWAGVLSSFPSVLYSLVLVLYYED